MNSQRSIKQNLMLKWLYRLWSALERNGRCIQVMGRVNYLDIVILSSFHFSWLILFSEDGGTYEKN
jgi:hypothetical protein